MDVVNIMTNNSPKQNDEFLHAVSFSWVGIKNPIRGVDGKDPQSWAEAMSLVVEYFGLPGDRYITRFDPNDIVFLFKHEQDAALCILKFR